MWLCPGKFRANAADLPPGHCHMFPGCANGRGLGNYSTTGKWPAVEQDQPANAEVPRGAPVAPPAADGRTLRRFNNNRASATRKMGLCPGIEPGKFRANAANLPPGHRHMFPGCADGRSVGNYSTTGKWPAVEQDQPASAEVPVPPSKAYPTYEPLQRQQYPRQFPG